MALIVLLVTGIPAIILKPLLLLGKLLKVLILQLLGEVDFIAVLVEPATEFEDNALIVIFGLVILQLVLIALFQRSDSLLGRVDLLGGKHAHILCLVFDFSVVLMRLLDFLVLLLLFFFVLLLLRLLFLFSVC